MSLHIKKKPRELIPADSYAARCYGLVDIGTQRSKYQGKETVQHKVIVFWELPELRIDIERDGRRLNMPKVKSVKYTASTDKKANLRKMLKGWRGKDFTSEEIADFDLHVIVGVPCLLQIVHEMSEANGEVYDNVASVTKLPKSMPIGAQETPELVFDLPEELPCPFPPNMPPWVQELIVNSDEWKRSQARGDGDAPWNGDGGAAQSSSHDDVDETPF